MDCFVLIIACIRRMGEVLFSVCQSTLRQGGTLACQCGGYPYSRSGWGLPPSQVRTEGETPSQVRTGDTPISDQDREYLILGQDRPVPPSQIRTWRYPHPADGRMGASIQVPDQDGGYPGTGTA